MGTRSEPTDKELYRVSVPKDQQSMMDDTPSEYIVTIPDECVCCLIYGKHGNIWHCNVSARWLVRHLIEQLAQLEADHRAMEWWKKHPEVSLVAQIVDAKYDGSFALVAHLFSKTQDERFLGIGDTPTEAILAAAEKVGK